MKLVLIGFMGSGKSTLAPLLAKRLGLKLVELDQVILAASGYSSISEIFEKEGEATFRKLETEAIQKLTKLDNIVVSCGGGVVLSKENISLLKVKNTKIVYLETDLEVIKKRLLSDNTRPLFKDPDKANDLYLKRLPLYKKYADYTVKSDHLSPDLLVEEVIGKLSTKIISFYAFLWIGLLIIALLNATGRELILNQFLNQDLSQQMSVFTALFLFFLFTLLVNKKWPLLTRKIAFRVGTIWMLQTAIFEFFMVVVLMGKPISIVLEQYNLADGNLWPVLLLGLLLIPPFVQHRY